MKYIKFFKELNNKDVPVVGGKNASIGEMFQELVPMGIKVPNGFAITSEAYWYLLDSGGIREKIKELRKSLHLSLEELSQKTKTSKILLKKIEENNNDGFCSNSP